MIGPTYTSPVDALACAVEAVHGIRRHLTTDWFEMEVYTGRHNELGYLTSVTTSVWSALAYSRDWTVTE